MNSNKTTEIVWVQLKRQAAAGFLQMEVQPRGISNWHGLPNLQEAASVAVDPVPAAGNPNNNPDDVD
jgi:hypothetical protein